jgi:hypothetical protein
MRAGSQAALRGRGNAAGAFSGLGANVLSGGRRFQAGHAITGSSGSAASGTAMTVRRRR